MLKECIEIFEKELDKYGDKLILDSYIPAEGKYIIISFTEEGYKIKENLDIKINKDMTIEGKNSLYYDEICAYDYYSRIINTQKVLDNNKRIMLSNNYLSFIIKRERLKDKKLINEVIKTYYEILLNPSIKYNKNSRSKEIYSELEEKLGKVDKELLIKSKNWINDNIFSLEDIGIKIEGKGYLKIFFEAPIELYQRENKRYMIPNIYNTNDFNKQIDDKIYGFANDNNNLNENKPYLKNKSRKEEIPYLVEIRDAIIQKKFFDYLLNIASRKENNVYINEEGIKSYKNDEIKKDDFSGIYLRIAKGKEVEIHDQDIISNYTNTLSKAFKLENILEISQKHEEDYYTSYNTKSDIQRLVSDILFSNYLINNYFTEPKDISLKDSKVKQNLILSRNTIFNYVHKGNDNNIEKIIDKVSTNLIKSSLNNGYIIKASHQFNLKHSFRYYFEGGSNMADVIYDIKNNVREKINSKDTEILKNDSEYYFCVGQLVNYLISLSKSKKKVHSLANQYINAKDDKIIKEKLRNLYKKYNYDIDINSRRIKNMYAMILSYQAEGKVDQDMIIAGYLHSNLIYEKSEEVK